MKKFQVFRSGKEKNTLITNTVVAKLHINRLPKVLGKESPVVLKKPHHYRTRDCTHDFLVPKVHKVWDSLLSIPEASLVREITQGMTQT